LGHHRFASRDSNRESVYSMQYESFDLFEEKIITMPAKSILGALDLECKLLEEDLGAFRSSFAEDEFSILCFRQFVRSVKSGAGVFPRRCLPPDHLELYKHTVVRLVHVAELPPEAMDAFEGSFVAEVYS
jgi:hypothetical protein